MPDEFNWLVQHPEIETQYSGEYVAILGEAVVAHGKNFEAVLEEAERHGNDPLIHKVQDADKDLVI